MRGNLVVFMDCHCVKTKELFHQRYDLAADDKWALTYGIKDSEFTQTSAIKSENRNIDFSKYRCGPQYRCPYCGNRSFVRCRRCGSLTCYSGNGDFQCVSCGITGTPSGYIDSLKGTEGDAQ